jgi:hypothetical protein
MKKVTTILRLGKKNYFIGLQNLEAKEIMKNSMAHPRSKKKKPTKEY